MKQGTSIVAALAVLLVFVGCRSYEPRPVEWKSETENWRTASAHVQVRTLDDAVTLALVANPEINRLRLKSARSNIEVKDVGWWEDPQLNIDFMRIINADANPNVFGASPAFTIPLSGVPGLESKAAEAYAEADALAVKAAEQRLAVDVRVAAVRWAAARRREEALRAELDDTRMDRAYGNVDKLLAIGEENAVDVFAARHRRHARSRALHEAEITAEEARVAFCRILGVMPTVKVDMPSDAWNEAEEAEESVPLPEELTEHFAVKAALARVNGNEATLHAEIRRQYPNLTVGPAYGREDGLNRIGFVAGLTLPLWNKNRKAISRAETERDIARLDAIETWKELVSGSVETAQLVCRLVSTIKRHKSSGCGQSPEAVGKLHEKGELTDIAYLAVRDELLESALEKIAWREKFLTAKNKLKYYSITK